MPRWCVHEDLGELCGIPRATMRVVNRLIDKDLGHDVGRLIAYCHWDPRELYKYVLHVYKLLGYEGIRAFMHHHLMDYICTIMKRGKYGVLYKFVAENLKAWGSVRLYEDIDSKQLYISPFAVRNARVVWFTRNDEVNPLSERLASMVLKVIENIVSDFSNKRDEISRYIVKAALEMRDCIRQSAFKLQKLYLDALINNSEDPCKPVKPKPRHSSNRTQVQATTWRLRIV